MSTKKSSLTYEPVSAWDSYATTTRRRQVNALAQRYIEFLSACKTERETIAYVQKRLAEAGFGEDFRKASVMRSLHGKCRGDDAVLGRQQIVGVKRNQTKIKQPRQHRRRAVN